MTSFRKIILMLFLFAWLVFAISSANMMSNADTSLITNATPTPPPRKTRIPLPGEATPVDEDYMPAIFRQEETPSTTLSPDVTPTPLPRKTLIPLP